MIPEIGHFALTLALLVSLVQSVVPMIGGVRQIRQPRPFAGRLYRARERRASG